jgi:hypothetical protein
MTTNCWSGLTRRCWLPLWLVIRNSQGVDVLRLYAITNAFILVRKHNYPSCESRYLLFINTENDYEMFIQITKGSESLGQTNEG